MLSWATPYLGLVCGVASFVPLGFCLSDDAQVRRPVGKLSVQTSSSSAGASMGRKASSMSKATEQPLSERRGVDELIGSCPLGLPTSLAWSANPLLLIWFQRSLDEKELTAAESHLLCVLGSRAASPRWPNAEEQQGDPARAQ